MVPLLEVKGDYAEMGLQYGVLMKPEIEKCLHAYKRILQWHAARKRVPFPVLIAYTKYHARKMAGKLPERFISEMKAISVGAGISYDVVLMVALFYDVSEVIDACSDVLMRGKNGTIIHGRNNDTTFIGGEETGRLTVVVRYHPDNYHSVTHKDTNDLDYTTTGSLWPQSNFGTQQMIIFELEADGFYLATGESMASRSLVYRVFEDFSRTPELFLWNRIHRTLLHRTLQGFAIYC